MNRTRLGRLAFTALLAVVPYIAGVPTTRAATVNVTLAWLAQNCGPHVAPNTILAIIGIESGGKPWAIDDDDTGTSYYPDTKEAAVEKANELLALGHTIDMGLMQVDSVHLQSYGVTTDQLFEPCRNVAIGSDLIRDAYHTALKKYPAGADALFHAFIAYNCGNLGPRCQEKSANYATMVWSEGNAIAAGLK